MNKIINIFEIYDEETYQKYIENAKLFNYLNIDLDKIRKNDLIAIIGDLIQKITNKSENNTEISKLIEENIHLKKQIDSLKVSKNTSSIETGMSTKSVMDAILNQGSFDVGYKTWN